VSFKNIPVCAELTVPLHSVKLEVMITVFSTLVGHQIFYI